MKRSCTVIASVLVASAVAITSSGDRDETYRRPPVEGFGKDRPGARRSGDKEKFAPRFDGLRFIETLVTAHR